MQQTIKIIKQCVCKDKIKSLNYKTKIEKEEEKILEHTEDFYREVMTLTTKS